MEKISHENNPDFINSKKYQEFIRKVKFNELKFTDNISEFYMIKKQQENKLENLRQTFERDRPTNFKLRTKSYLIDSNK